jgi:hypothetical protein
VPVGLGGGGLEVGEDVLVPQVEHLAERQQPGVELETNVGQLDDEPGQCELRLLLGAVEGAAFVDAATGRRIATSLDHESPRVSAAGPEVPLRDDRLFGGSGGPQQRAPTGRR